MSNEKLGRFDTQEVTGGQRQEHNVRMPKVGNDSI